MAEKTITLVVTPIQANSLAIALKMVKEMLSVAPGTAVYPNLGDFNMEREKIKAIIDETHAALLPQLEAQMPKK